MKAIVAVLSGLLIVNAAHAQESLRTARPTYSPLMDVLKNSRDVVVTDAQLKELESIQIEAIWDAIGDYQGTYVTGFHATQPGQQIAGRALTIRFLPLRPDVRDGLNQLATEGNWAKQSYARVSEEAKPGDIIVADLGGASGDQMFGDVAGLGIMLAGVRGAVVDGGVRDQDELRDKPFANFPVYARYYDIDTTKWLPAEWNIPVRMGQVTVLPGDIVVANDTGALFFPPQIVEKVLEKARAKIKLETFQRKVLREKKHRFRDVYPDLSLELAERYRRESNAK